MKQFLVVAAIALAAAKAPAQLTNATAQASSPEVAIVAPTNNHTIRLGGFIDIQARAVDRDNGISRLEILDGIGVISVSNYVARPGETRSISFRWTPTNVLSRPVYARATDSTGLVATSAPVRVVVDHPADRVYFASRYWTGDGFAWGEYNENGPIGSDVLFHGDPVIQRGPYYYGANKSGGHIFYRVHAEYDTLAEVPADGQSPAVNWPRDVAYDSTRDRILGVTLAGEGHLYVLSPTLSHSIASMANYDVDSMVYHKPNDRLYMVENWHDDNHLNILRFTPQGVLESSETIAIRDVPVKVGSWYRSRLVSGGELIALLIEPTPGWSQTAPIESRMYIINPQTKAVTLAYRKEWDQWPPNAGSNPPTITIVEPGPDAAINPEKIVPITVEASDPDNDLQKIEILVAGVLVDEFVYVHSPTGATRQTALWRPSKPGTYALLARATDRRGNTFETRLQVNLTQEAAVIATRDLPPNYIPGLAFQVSITASPNAATDAWAVEEVPPLGWQVGAISHGGFFDAATKKIKWGPFTEQASLTITYFITPPANLVGIQTFSGNTSANGISRLIEGDKQITNGPIYHPADAPPEDNRLTLNEVTAYAAAWRSGSPWPRGHVRGIIPVTYVTRAGMIWKNGETYVHLPNIEPPACWAPTNQRPRAASMAEPSRTTREFAGPLTPNNPTRVTIRVKPPAGISTYAIEESVPAGWTISNSGDGVASAGKIRFGPFYDNLERTLAYTVLPDAADSIGKVSGTLSYDGSFESITSVGEPGGQMLRAEKISAEEVRIHCATASGNPYVLETAPSIDSEAWTSLGTIEDGQYIVRPTTASQQFYRIRPATP